MVGKLMVSGNLKVEDFKIIDFTLNISPSGFSATTEFNAVIDATYSPEELNSLTKAGKDQKFDLVSLSGSNDLLEIAVPGAGLVVPQIFSLGMIASIETGFAMEFKGKTAFTAGVKATLPDSAKILLDLTDLDKSTATGFEGANAEPIFKVDSASARIDGTLYFRPKFALKAEVMSVGELSANIKVGLPQINAGAEVAFDENGVCEGSPEKTGVRFNLGGAINLVVGLTGQVAGIGGTVERTLASLDLFTSLKKCVPVKIDALAVQSVINAAGNSTWLAPRLVGPRAVRGASQLFRRNY